jgi:hypothetical protein
MTSYALRVPDHIYEQAKAAAEEDNVSINQILVSFIAEGLGHRRGLRMMRERAARADIGAALAILDQVPDVAPDAGDELPEDANATASSPNRTDTHRPRKR